MPTTTCCPACESANIYPTSAVTMHDRVAEHRFRCRACKTGFDEAGEREAKNPIGQDDPTAPPEGTLAAKLWEMDPDDIGGSA